MCTSIVLLVQCMFPIYAAFAASQAKETEKAWDPGRFEALRPPMRAVNALTHGGEVFPGCADHEIYIGGVDHDMLARKLYPDSVRVSDTPSFAYTGAQWTYQKQTSGETFELIMGIYRDDCRAIWAFQRTFPQIPRRTPDCNVRGFFFSARGCHIRVRNVVVLVLEDRWVANYRAGYDDAAERCFLVSGLRTALDDPAVATMGSSVNTPKLQVLDVTRLPGFRAIGYAGWKTILSVDGDDGLLFRERTARRLGDGRYEVTGRPSWLTGRTICAMRVTGEVCLLPVGNLVDSATKVQFGGVKRGDVGKRRLSEAERIDMINKLRERQGDKANIGKLSLLAEYLAAEPTQECVPLFLEILSSDCHSDIKEFALRGVAKVRRREGLPNYREYAADRTQPTVVRTDAIMLIREFGTKNDLVFLRRLRDEMKTWPEEEKRYLSPTGYPSLDAVWWAIRRLEAKFSDD